MNTIELCPSAVFGPSIMKKFGNAEVAMPSLAAKPVPRTIVSTRRGDPSAATTASVVISRRPVVTSSTLLR